MVNPVEKGARTELKVRDELRKLSGLPFERTPGSGALDPKHQLKGDLYLVGEKNLYCIEVKGYADCQLTTTLFTAKDPLLLSWWQQTERQGAQVSKKPLLIFKHDRSPLFVGFKEMPNDEYPYIFINIQSYEFYVALLSDWFKHEKPKFILE